MNTRQASRDDWHSNKSLESINAGSLQRIADATEVMARNYNDLIRERDRYKEWYIRECARADRAQRKAAALRGVITKMKNAAAKGGGGP